MANATRPNDGSSSGSSPFKITARIALIGVEQARELLALNTHNRATKEAKVEEFAAAMLAAEWGLTWDALAVSDEGVLLNGQHRLLAVIASERPQRFLLVEGLPAPSQDVGDRGAKRLLADVLKLHGEENTSGLAALTRGMWIFETCGIPATGAGMSTTMLPIGVAFETLDRHPGLRDHITPRLTIAGLGQSQVNLWRYVLNSIDNDDAAGFFDALVGGQDNGRAVMADDPRFILRELLIRDSKSPSRSIKPRVKAAIVTKAWNAYRQGEKPRSLSWRGGGSSNKAEAFPLIDGWEYTESQLRALGVEP